MPCVTVFSSVVLQPRTNISSTRAITLFIIRRFLLHVLPAGFHRIRSYGFLSNRHRAEKLARCRQLLGTTTPPPISLARDGPWVANYDDDSCQLLAKFGKDKASIIARFTRFQPSDGFDLALTGESLERPGPTSKVKLAFGPGQPEREAFAIVGTVSDKPLLIFNGQRLDGWERPFGRKDEPAPKVAPAQEAAVSALTVRLGGKRNYRLELGPMDKPMAAMRTCMDNLLTHWGYDPKAIAATGPTLSKVSP